MSDITKGFKDIIKTLDLTKLKEQNKLKVWTDNPIQIDFKNGGIVDNSNDLKKAVTILETTLKDSLSSTNSLDEVLMYKDNLNIVSTWLKGCRLQLTKPLDELKKSFTENEKVLDNLKDDIKLKEDSLLEEIYKVRRIHIFNEFQELEDNLGFAIEVDFKVFESFADDKKKNKSFDVNTKGKLNAAAKEQILKQFHLVVDPIIKEKMLQEEKQKEQQLLTMQLSKIKTTGTNEDLESNIKELNLIEDTLDTYFPNIKDNAKSQILSLNKVIHDSINQNDKISKEQKQNLKDLAYIAAIGIIDTDNSDIVSLTALIEDIQNCPDLNNMLPANRKKVSDIISSLDARILELRNVKLRDVQVPKVEAAETPAIYPAGKETIELKQYKLSESDIKFISEIKISAVDENVAIENMVNYIANHLAVSGLKEV